MSVKPTWQNVRSAATVETGQLLAPAILLPGSLRYLMFLGSCFAFGRRPLRPVSLKTTSSSLANLERLAGHLPAKDQCSVSMQCHKVNRHMQRCGFSQLPFTFDKPLNSTDRSLLSLVHLGQVPARGQARHFYTKERNKEKTNELRNAGQEEQLVKEDKVGYVNIPAEATPD